MLANYHRRNGDRTTAGAQFEAAAQNVPTMQTLLALASFYSEDRTRDADAEAAYRKALELAKPEEVATPLRAARQLLLRARSLRRWRGGAREGHRAGPGSARPDLRAGAACTAQKGDVKKADELMERATQKQPDQMRPWLVLSSYRGSQGDLEGALAAVEKALELDPKTRGFAAAQGRGAARARLSRSEAGAHRRGPQAGRRRARGPAVQSGRAVRQGQDRHGRQQARRRGPGAALRDRRAARLGRGALPARHRAAAHRSALGGAHRARARARDRRFADRGAPRAGRGARGSRRARVRGRRGTPLSAAEAGRARDARARGAEPRVPGSPRRGAQGGERDPGIRARRDRSTSRSAASTPRRARTTRRASCCSKRSRSGPTIRTSCAVCSRSRRRWGRREESLARIQKALAEKPDDPKLQQLAAVVALSQGQASTTPRRRSSTRSRSLRTT